MNEKEREIFYKLLVDLFTDNPQRKRHQAKEGRKTDEDISTRERNRTAKPDNSQTATDN